jgi:calcineurin-like phosphoesterase family protein
MSVFFTADQHFGHENIIKYCDRPFGCVEGMDEHLVQRWNEVVGPTDIVYHLGDFTLFNAGAAIEYFSRLNGVIRVLRYPWHHDGRWIPKIADMMNGCRSKGGHIVTFHPPMVALEFPEYGSGKWAKPVILCHYPLAEWDRKHYGAWHLHGHSHGNHRGEGAILDVGVDSTGFVGYRPVSIETVAKVMATKDV